MAAPRVVAPRLVALAGLTALAVAMGIGRFAFTPILPMMQADAGVSITAGGWLAAANYVGYLAGALTAARAGLPASTATRLGLATIGATTTAMAVTHDLALWLVLRGLAGIASAWVLVHVSAWSLDQLGRAGRPALRGVVFAGVGTGIALAGVTCLALMELGMRSWHAWVVLGILALGLAALIWPAFRSHDGASAAPRPPAREAGTTIRPDAVRLVVCYGAFGFGYIIPATFVPVMARGVVDDPAVFGWAWPLFGVAAALSPMVVAIVSTNAARAWMATQLVMAAGVAMPLIAPGVAGIALAACAVGGTFMVVTMLGMQEARGLAGASAPRLMAAMTAAFGAGQILGPLCVSAAAGLGAGFAPALLLATLVLLASAAALAPLSRSARSRGPARTPSSTSPAARRSSPSRGPGRD